MTSHLVLLDSSSAEPTSLPVPRTGSKWHTADDSLQVPLLRPERGSSGQEAPLDQIALRRAHARIAELEQALDAVRALIHEDPLTGLLNRRGFKDAMEREISRARRQTLPLCVVAFDIDDFKTINDRFGHDVGDSALLHLAGVVKGTLRKTDIFARFGGEEFVIALPGATPGQAVLAADRAQNALRHAPLVGPAHGVVMTFSAGAATFSPEDELGTLLKRADEGLYRAKQGGKDRVVLV